MLTLTIRFLAGRFYATGWDHQVNEGTIEWPPAPWRLLRALVAASYRLREAPDDARLTALLEPLAEALPVYAVPPWSEGHARHYMPLDNKGLPGDKSTLVFNAFVAPGSGADEADGEVAVVWEDVTLDDASFALLEELCEQVAYVGRAESWAAVTASRDATGAKVNCRPAADDVEGERVRLMAAARRAEHLAWHEQETSGKKKKDAPPRSLLEVLRQDTGEIRKTGWSSVPGARWVVYDLARRHARRRVDVAVGPLPTHALYRLSGPVLPSVTKTLQVGERFHQALVAWSDIVGGGAPLPVFTGPADRTAKEDSGHAAVMPFDADGDGRIEHVLVCAGVGFDGAARRALELGRSLTGVGAYKYRVTLVGLWREEELDAMVEDELPPPLRRSRRWRSSTPFVLTRHPRPRADGTVKDGPTAQLLLELKRRGLPVGDGELAPKITDAAALGLHGGGRNIPWYRFQRKRFKGPKGKRTSDHGYGFEIEFPVPVRGPITGGYGRYLGLGQFSPVDEDSPDSPHQP